MPRSRALPRPRRLIRAASKRRRIELLIYLHFTSALGARQWTDSTQGGASIAAGKPPAADAGVAARHRNGSGAVGRDTIVADRKRHVQRRR